MSAEPQIVPIDRIFLDVFNPRHAPYGTETEVIEYLCRHEYVYALAKDIAKIGLNPLELFALIPVEKVRGWRTKSPLIVAEGNRRLCAIKLLNDPDLAPAELRKDFAKLAEKAPLIKEVSAILFEDKAQVDTWLGRIHGGVQGGVGRKPWNAEQKTRHIGDKKNQLAQAVLDYAEDRGFITSADRKGKLTTAQRFLGNQFFREAFGIESNGPDDVSRNRPEEDFDLVLKTFINDLSSNQANSRMNSDQIKTYARKFGMIPGVTGRRVNAESLIATSGKKKKTRPRARLKKPKHISYEEKLSKALDAIPSFKLARLYFSICDVGLDSHTPLISVGVWSFIETLTARCGRNSNTAFADFLSKNKLVSLGFKDTRVLTEALHRVAAYGNTTKHHDTSANFNGEQLANDMETLRDLLIKLA